MTDEQLKEVGNWIAKVEKLHSEDMSYFKFQGIVNEPEELAGVEFAGVKLNGESLEPEEKELFDETRISQTEGFGEDNFFGVAFIRKGGVWTAFEFHS